MVGLGTTARNLNWRGTVMAGKSYSLLIVDDSLVILKLLSEALTREGYRVRTVDDPLRGYHLIENEHFDIVLSDIEMPGMNGLELLRKIKNHNGMIAVIIMTGYITINNILNAFRYGAADLLFKPLQLEEVKQAVADAARKLDRVNSLLARVSAQKGE